ncbi:MAG: hypothetical protein JW782_06210 [Candidatus Saganbacteria bacterium]|nr:hypothetical protein [Candidatus Saganbacteria bacterium]
MAKNVFILGAGTSVVAGAPLMSNFLDKARLLGLVNRSEDNIDMVFRAIEELRVAHFKSYIDLDNIESVFGAIEMSRILKRFGVYSKEDIEKLSNATKRLIVLTLENSIKFEVSGSGAKPFVPHADFVKMIVELGGRGRMNEVAVITFNYDILIDYACYYQRVPIEYCLAEAQYVNSLKYLKLHGSLNWATCKKCGSIVPWHFSDFFSKYHFSIWPGETKSVHIDIGSKIGNMEHCAQKVSGEPFIVPPTWNKSEYHKFLSNVWSQAAKELSDAENIFIIGFSLPETDMFFKYLFALGSIGSGHIERFWVFNPDNSGGVENRYRELIGTGIQRRFKYLTLPFREALPKIKSELRLK